MYVPNSSFIASIISPSVQSFFRASITNGNKLSVPEAATQFSEGFLLPTRYSGYFLMLPILFSAYFQVLDRVSEVVAFLHLLGLHDLFRLFSFHLIQPE